MKFKKFKHDLKKDNLVIPLMSDELKNYSNAIAQERQIEKQEQLKTKSHFNWSRYLNRVIPIMTVFIIALIVILSGNLFRKPFEEKNGYELYTVQNEEDFQRIINYNNIDEDINSSQEPQGPGGEQGEQGKPGESGDAAKPDYSNTNLQEENVDESDVVKTDGKSIYYVNNKNGILYKYNIKKDELTSVVINKSLVVNLEKPTIYVTDKYVIVLQSYYIVDITPIEKKVSFTIYDKDTLEVKKDYVGNGEYIDSRLTNDTFYLIYLKKDVKELPSDKIDNKLNNYNYQDIKYSCSNINKGYTFIVALNMNKLKLNVKIQLGVNSWNAVYMTENSLYLVSSNLCNVYNKYSIMGSLYDDGYQTNIFRYELDGININCTGIIYTSGMIKDQFYLDEYNNHLRLVTEDTITDQRKLEIYSLNSKSNYGSYVKVALINKGIGKPGETIESVKFEDKSCLVVTYLKVIDMDPLYYIDLTDQYNPKIISGYDEPNYNTYLHYINDKYALGFGVCSTTFTTDKTFAIYVNNKFALYDITNGEVNKLEEILYYTHIGVLNTHKALYIEDEIFSFPGYIYGFKVFVEEGKNGLNYEYYYTYSIYTIDYENETPKIKLINMFTSLDNVYERMIRVEDKYYLVSEKYIEILNSEFNVTKQIDLQ